MTDDRDIYSQLGVSSRKNEVHEAIKTLNKGLFPGAFCKIVRDIANRSSHCSIFHSDGAGTKSSLAYMYFKETNDIDIFRGIVRDAIIMNIDDVLCVGATGDFFISNNIGRNGKIITGDIISVIIDEYDKFSIDFADTTIYQKETIMQMFSTALKKVSDTSEIIENILEDFTQTIEGKATSLISMDGLIFGSYNTTDTDEALLNNTALIMQTLSNFHNSIGLVRETTITLDFPLNRFTIRGEKLFEYSELRIPVYLWLLSENPDLLYEKIDYFREQLLPLINMFL